MVDNKALLVEHVAKFGTGEGWQYLAEKFGFSTGEAARSYVKRQRKAGKLVLPSLPEGPVNTTHPKYTVNVVPKGPGETHTINADGSREIVGQHLPVSSTVDSVLRAHNLDPAEWTLLDWQEAKWDAQVASEDGGAVQTLYSYRIKVKPVSKLPASTVRDSFAEFLASYKGSSIPTPVKESTVYKGGSNCLIISLSDLHLEKQTYGDEVGGEDEGMEEAYNRALAACYSIVSRASASSSIAEIVLIAGNDFFHVNNAKNTTVAGTPLDADGRWHKSFRYGLQLATTLIDFCKEYAPVKYFTVPGNHSAEREHYLSIAVEAFYRNDHTVTVETVSNSRKYFKFGNSAFMLTHEPPNSKAHNLPVVFITEQPKLYADAKYRFVLTGHLHKKNEMLFTSTSENFGLVFKIMPSLSSTDKWHHDNQFIGNHKSCIGLMINDQYGDVMELIYND